MNSNESVFQVVGIPTVDMFATWQNRVCPTVVPKLATVRVPYQTLSYFHETMIYYMLTHRYLSFPE